MSGLLDEVLTAHGGLERWRAATALTAHGRFSGLLSSRFPGNRMAPVSVRVELAKQHAVITASHNCGAGTSTSPRPRTTRW
jgi:hypothetical protein